ncbi:Re/Si-specific NAD(P)(+) transhydrogenase subunit alpha [Schaalia suimastitidis]|uniref:Re/Si-specific NAD(P)(+) transhydrogenase subunit alpha n=1 Tax=Schaalia suimastitidis TaxID=121163 RepID=UPI0004185F53|nr:Re/Si-specific NAD(P)(+) transhydrogenase subunit alpha [Schaalia suimastitidis]
MRIGVPQESVDQPLVAATPVTTKALIRLGYEVCIQRGAGERSHFLDADYETAGARLVNETDAWASDIVIALDAPSDEQIAMMRPGASLITRLAPARNAELLDKLRAANITALALDTVPRISRAQSMDVLSSQANIAGYRAVIEAAALFGRMFTGQITAAGKMPPAKVYVIGAGVAGLAAIGTAAGMGAQVWASDVRPEVAEQIASLGATHVALPTGEEKSLDGYAKELSHDIAAAANAVHAAQAAQADIVITTASIPGRTAPILLDEAAVAGMNAGSIIVDMAAATGGNCALTVPGEITTTANGVRIIGLPDLAALLPTQSSQLYGRNVVSLITLMTPDKDGQLTLNFDDEIIRSITVTYDGGILWPPPPVQVSAPVAEHPSDNKGDATPVDTDVRKEASAQARQTRRMWSFVGLGAAIAAFSGLVLVTPSAATSHYVVLMLAIILGFYVISNVTPALHTPLMSVTNAISGIILIGAISQIGHENPLIAGVSFVAIVLSTINIVGGFAVTHRMLAMFTKD